MGGSAMGGGAMGGSAVNYEDRQKAFERELRKQMEAMDGRAIVPDFFALGRAAGMPMFGGRQQPSIGAPMPSGMGNFGSSGNPNAPGNWGGGNGISPPMKTQPAPWGGPVYNKQQPAPPQGNVASPGMWPNKLWR